MKRLAALVTLVLMASTNFSAAQDQVMRLNLPSPILFANGQQSADPTIEVDETPTSVIRSGKYAAGRFSTTAEIASWSIEPAGWLTISDGVIAGRAPTVSTPTRYDYQVVATPSEGDPIRSEQQSVTVYPNGTASFNPNHQRAVFPGSITPSTATFSRVYGVATCAPSPKTGILPPGVTIAPDCTVSGAPTSRGFWQFDIDATDGLDGNPIQYGTLSVASGRATLASRVDVDGYGSSDDARRHAMLLDGDLATYMFNGQASYALPMSTGNFGSYRTNFYTAPGTIVSRMVVTIACPHVIVNGNWGSNQSSALVELYRASSTPLASLNVPNTPQTFTVNLTPGEYPYLQLRATGQHTACYLTEAYLE